MNDCSSVLRDYSSKSAEHPATAPAGSSPSSYGAKGLSSRQMQDVVRRDLEIRPRLGPPYFGGPP